MYTIILAGGFGTRLFPLSRSSFPKQFISLFGERSLFQKAVIRSSLFSKPAEIYIVTNTEHKFLVQDQLNQINIPAVVLEEPCGKNTLPAITYATLKIHEKDRNAIILVLSSDQLLDENENYKNAILTAINLAKDSIVTFGVVPTTPHTGYGYIQSSDAIRDGFRVSSFKEKPDLETAKQYVEKGYLWNAGIFCFSAKLFLDECRKHSPDVIEAFSNEVAEAYKLTPKISIDYGLLEKTENVAVVPLDTLWNDMGSFEAFYSVREKDDTGNVVDGEYISPDGENNLIISEKLVATIGLSDIAVIDTDDVLVITKRDQTQSIGKIVDVLQDNKDERIIHHTKVHRPWGNYTTLMKTKTYHVKKLLIEPNKGISLQYHNHRSEHWVVVNGVAEVTNGNRMFVMNVGENTFIPAGVIHRLVNNSDDVLEIIEVQNGDYVGEDDIVRIEDDYGRE